MGQELQLPDWATAGMPDAFKVLNSENDSLSDGIGQSYPVIGYKGKVWSYRYRGERKNLVRPDDGTPASYIDVIILGQAKLKSKSYYEAFDPNNSEGGRPLCSSIDGVLPDSDVQRKQADSCALCPRNQWKQQPNGKKGRDCSDFKRLAVLVLPTQLEKLFNQNIVEPAFLRVPAGSLNSLAIMGDTMDGKGIHYSSYITRITFDPNEAHPKMQFRPIQPLSANEAPVILGMRDDMQVGRIISGGFSESIRTVPPQEGTTLLPPGSVPTGIGQQGVPQGQTLNLQANPGTSVQSTAGTGNPTQGTTKQGTVSSGLGGAQPATQTAAAPTPTPSVPSGTLATGLLGGATPSGGATPAQTQPAQPQPGTPAQNSVGDAGAPEAADADLDSMIAGALGGLGKPN